MLRSTSRARNDAWYKDALDLDFQLHLRADGTGVFSALYERKNDRWIAGPTLDEETLKTSEKASVFAADLVTNAQKAGYRSIGVILHLADEFATTELKQSLDNPGALPELREAAETDPASILEDSSISGDQYSWRLVPYPAAGSESIATAITISRHFDPFLEQLRQAGERANFPVVTSALSAPLITLLTIPKAIRPGEGRPFMTVLHYASFTVLAFFNEHSDLQLIRALQHRGQRRPSNLRHAASTTTAALEFVDPEIYLFTMNGLGESGLIADLRVVFPSSRVEEIDWSHTPFVAKDIPAHMPELTVATHRTAAIPEGTLSHTFTVLLEERWAFQNFLPLARNVAEIYPTRSEIRFLRAIRFIRAGIAACAVLALAWLASGAYRINQQTEWAFDPASNKVIQQRLVGLNAEKTRVEHWDNLLEDRSKAWTSMELLCRLFPERGGFLIKGYSHTVRADQTAGQVKQGFVKEWRISGFAREEAMDRLNLINTREGISAVFSEISQITRNEAFRPDIGNRSLMPNVRTSENASFRPRAQEEIEDSNSDTYPYTFDLTITQRFEAADPLAIITAKAP